MQNLILTYASGERYFDCGGFGLFLKSFERNVRGAKLVVFTHDMPAVLRDKYEQRPNIEVVDVPREEMDYIFVDRHLAYYNYLSAYKGHPTNVLCCDSRDVVFQTNPFLSFFYWAPYTTQVGFVSEGFTTGESEFSLKEMVEFQNDVPPIFRDFSRKRPVLNGGVMGGCFDHMKSVLLNLWAVGTKTKGECTDQAALNWLQKFLVRDKNNYVFCPKRDSFCLTGEGVLKGVVYNVRDGLICRPDAEAHERVYAILHQWEREPQMRELVLAQLA